MRVSRWFRRLENRVDGYVWVIVCFEGFLSVVVSLESREYDLNGKTDKAEKNRNLLEI